MLNMSHQQWSTVCVTAGYGDNLVITPALQTLVIYAFLKHVLFVKRVRKDLTRIPSWCVCKADKMEL